MPQKENIIASKTPSGEVHIFDYTKHPSNPEKEEIKPEIRLQGHDAEGYGLCWNDYKEGLLLSGAYDKKICLWQI